MFNWDCLPYLGVLIVTAVANKILDDCISSNPKYTLNVVLLEDNDYEWSLQYVKSAVERAIEEDRQENINQGMGRELLHRWSERNVEYR